MTCAGVKKCPFEIKTFEVALDSIPADVGKRVQIYD